MQSQIRRIFWFMLGVILVAIAYVGVILPGIPWSTPAVGAAYCFSKSSTRFHKWLYSHKIFGPFLTNWEEKKVFPTKAKYLMVITMMLSLLVMWFTTGNIAAISYLAIFMALVIVWGWRFPGSLEEHDRRVKEGKRIAWLK